MLCLMFFVGVGSSDVAVSESGPVRRTSGRPSTSPYKVSPSGAKSPVSAFKNVASVAYSHDSLCFLC